MYIECWCRNLYEKTQVEWGKINMNLKEIAVRLRSGWNQANYDGSSGLLAECWFATFPV
jgi:hypothetical protein